MSRNDKGNGNSDGSDQQLPRPQVVLKEEWYGREQGGQDATDSLGTEMQDDARHEAAQAAKQAEIGEETVLKHTGKAHSCPTDTRSKADEYPHHQDDVLVECATARALVVLVQEIHHQGNAHQGNAQPKPRAPVLVPYHKGGKLQQQDNCRRIAPRQKQVLAREVLAAHDLATHSGNYIQFLGCIHKALGLYLKQDIANIVFIF